MACILVVDDENIVVRYIQHVLSGLGHTSEAASSGEEAVEKAGRVLPDLVLMDVVLKGRMTGVEAARVIRDRHDIPVIFLTGQREDVLREAQISGCISKPFDETELQIVIDFALKRHAKERRSAPGSAAA
jgi:CheY-like chemotaxis protein